jgi:predicted transcriptional regulator
MKEKKVTRLTKAEEQVMQILWELREAVVKDLMEHFEEPKPAYTTVATVLRVLEKKGFVSFRKVGNTYLYSPVVSKVEYTRFQVSNLLTNYFNGSFPKMATFFAKENDISIADLENILKAAHEEMDNEKENDHE